MSEGQVIKNTGILSTRDSLREDLKKLGIKEGMTLLVHSSLSSLGWVCGGEVAVIQALMDVLTPEGTLVMPTHTGDYSDPKDWENPPVPREWWEIIRDKMPAYEPEITPTRGVGIIPETFRNFPNVIRSSHPAVSFCAWGKNSREVIAKHSLNYGLGEKSPLGRIYDLDGSVLLLGCGYGNNTSFHLAEYRISTRTEIKAAAPIIKDGKRVWQEYKDIDYNDELFSKIGEDFETHHTVINGRVGMGKAKLFAQREAVDFAYNWLE